MTPPLPTYDVTRPPLKWAGGKRWQIPHVRPLWEPHAHRRFVELFCGGAAMTLGLQPTRALVNDVNPHLVNFYRWAQAGLLITIPMENDEAMYYAHRERFNALIGAGETDQAEAASLFYYLNRTGFNGLCRFNASGRFNVPFGRYKTIRYTRDFAPCIAAWSGWTVTCADVEAVPFEPDDFIYADPPYDVDFTTYSAGGFSFADQERTAARLARHLGPVVLVNQATPRIESLYRDLGFDVQFFDAPRRISCTGDRQPAREIMATRNLAKRSDLADVQAPPLAGVTGGSGWEIAR